MRSAWRERFRIRWALLKIRVAPYGGKIWRLRAFRDRLTHPRIYRMLPSHLRDAPLRFAIDALTFDHGELRQRESIESRLVKENGDLHRKLAASRLQARSQGVPDCRRLMEAFGFSGEDVN